MIPVTFADRLSVFQMQASVKQQSSNKRSLEKTSTVDLFAEDVRSEQIMMSMPHKGTALCLLSF